MLLKIIKLVLVSLMTLGLGGAAFLHGFRGWRAGQVEVWRKGQAPFVATVDGALPITFTVEVWSWMIIGAGVFLLGVGIVIKFLFAARAERQAMLARMDDAFLRSSREEPIPRGVALAIIGAVVAFFVYLGFRIHAQ
ncbi:hypothetical protein [Variovorax sp. UC122_21]|uniref:hypothetical protein n=1 Tax=Variovorax sp. UC122_21 TaxID=3374554 RepID=UPI003758014E